MDYIQEVTNAIALLINNMKYRIDANAIPLSAGRVLLQMGNTDFRLIQIAKIGIYDNFIQAISVHQPMFGDLIPFEEAKRINALSPEEAENEIRVMITYAASSIPLNNLAQLLEDLRAVYSSPFNNNQFPNIDKYSQRRSNGS